MVQCNDGTTVTKMGNFINTSKGTYTFMGNMLTGPNGFISRNIRSVDEAVGIVIGLHGGKRL